MINVITQIKWTNHYIKAKKANFQDKIVQETATGNTKYVNVNYSNFAGLYLFYKAIPLAKSNVKTDKNKMLFLYMSFKICLSIFPVKITRWPGGMQFQLFTLSKMLRLTGTM